jgi:MSHA pilin protein MshC
VTGTVQRGFTLMELVTVIAIAAILAAFAAATINTRSFDTEGVANKATAAVRYAQRLAISQRRNVAVTVAGNAIALTYPDAPLSGAAVREPPGTNAFTVSKSGITITATAGSFTFSALGRPDAGGTITVTGDGSRTITIEAETGYVR